MSASKDCEAVREKPERDFKPGKREWDRCAIAVLADSQVISHVGILLSDLVLNTSKKRRQFRHFAHALLGGYSEGRPLR